jgi:hypothetical protein
MRTPATIPLSEAIDLGRTLEKPGHGFSFRGCALGLAMAAVGVPRAERDEPTVEALWPWITKRTGRTFMWRHVTLSHEIQMKYFEVRSRFESTTLDQLIDYVRSIEPPAALVEAEHDTELVAQGSKQ